MLKRALSVMMIVMAFLFIPVVGYAQTGEGGAGDIFKSYILFDSSSGQVVSEKNSTQVYEDIGLSQMMSLLLFFECLDDGTLTADTEISVSSNAASAAGPQMFLDQNGVYTVSDLLYGVVMVAAGDACAALSENIAGDSASFVKLMNDKALKIGMNDTVFTSISGYNTIGEKTTAADMAILAKELIKHTRFFEYSDVWQHTIVHNDGRTTDLVNANRLVKSNAYCDGMGVGSGEKNGYSIIASAASGDSHFVLIGIGADSSTSRFSEADSIINFAYNAYTTKTFVKEGQIVKKDYVVTGGPSAETALYAKDEISLMLKIGEENNCEKNFELFEEVTLPLYAGDTVGRIVISYGGKVLGESDVVVASDILPVTFESSLHKIFLNWIGR